MSEFMRAKFPRVYAIYQETIGEIYYELLGMGPLVRRIAQKRLHEFEKMKNDPIEVAFTFDGIGPYKNIRPVQIKSEISKFYRIVKDSKPKVICEIGCGIGGTLYLWSKILPPDSLIISIDLPRLYRKSLNRFLSSFFNESHQVFFLRQNSHSLKCLERLKTILDGKKIDFLFIDADHSYEGVKQDFKNYSTFVKKDGLIAFHDIVKHDLPEEVCNADKFWSEIKSYFKHEEIVEDSTQKWGGIGLLYFDPEEECPLI